MRELIGDAPGFDFETEAGKMQREPDGQLSVYTDASCALDETQLFAPDSDGDPRVMQTLRQMGATHIFVSYNGGGDEGFATLESVQILGEQLHRAQLVERLRGLWFQSNDKELRESAASATVDDDLDGLAYDLALQLLGAGYGTGEYSLEGRFVADLQTNTLTDIAPSEEL